MVERGVAREDGSQCRGELLSRFPGYGNDRLSNSVDSLYRRHPGAPGLERPGRAPPLNRKISATNTKRITPMQVTIDSHEPIERVLPVINALYGTSLSVSDSPATSSATPRAAARRARSPKSATRAPTGRRNKRAAITPGAVREWARANGHQVSSRGRISAELLDAYRAAN